MSANTPVPPLQGAIITGIQLVDRIERRERMRFDATSLPGHLIHFVLAGRVEQYSSGMRQELTPGSTVWYHEDETVTGRIMESPWVFYTVSFTAPTIQPPPFDRRVARYSPETLGKMERLYRTWHDTAAPATTRQLRLHALLLEIILDVLPAASQRHRMDEGAGLWWQIESKLRQDLSRPIDLESIRRLARRSVRTITRACYLSVGKPPMKRVKELRLSYARGLVCHSELSMTEIAFRVGYGRVQEFSRDYNRTYGKTPSDDRRMAKPIGLE